MVYHKVTLGPTDGQLHDLSHGTEVKLSHEHFRGAIPFELTTTQIKKISKAAAGGKGCTLKFSPSQIKHHAQHGSGRFTDMLRSGYNLLKPVLKVGLSKGLDYTKKLAENKISHLAGLDQTGGNLWDDIAGFFGGELEQHHAKKASKSKAPKKQLEGDGFIGDTLGWLGHKAVNGLVDVLGGEIKPKPKRVRKQKGAGWIGDIAKKIGHAAVDTGVHFLGGEVNPMANPNEMLCQKKFPSGKGLYQ